MSQKTLTFVLVIACCGLLLSAFSPAEVTTPEPRTIFVRGEAEIRVVPDEVILTLGVQTWDDDLEISKRDNDRIIKRVLAIVAKYKIDSKYVQTDFFSIQPYFDDYDHLEQVNGYAVRKTVVITLKDINMFEAFLSDVLETGVTHVHGIDFRTTELRKYRDQARELAIIAAHEKAGDMAGALDQSIGDALHIQEDYAGWWSWYGSSWWGSSYGGMSQNVVQNASPSGGNVDLESGIAPGQITISARVSATFELK